MVVCDAELIINNPDEFIYLYNKRKAYKIEPTASIAVNTRHNVLRLITSKNPITSHGLIAYYRLHKSMPLTYTNDDIVSNYIRLLCKVPVNIKQYDDCTDLLWFMGDELYNERHIITILRYCTDYDSLISVYRGHRGHQAPIANTHKLLFLCILYNLLPVDHVNNFILDNCEICQRIRTTL